tara:strand:+ start:13944 stop:15146 length:1203 start_codon:yes stop_codon:yes gene_type:complete
VSISSFISKRFFLSKSSWNIVNIISHVASFVLVIATCAFFVVLSVFSGLKDFGLNYSKSFDPDIKISHLKEKHFNITSLPVEKIVKLFGVSHLSQIIEEKVLLNNDDKNSYGFLTGLDQAFSSVVEIDSVLVMGRWVSQDLNDVVVSATIADNLNLGLFNYDGGLNILVPSIGKRSSVLKNPFDSMFLMPTGIFQSGDETDQKNVFTSLGSARKLLSLKEGFVSGVLIKANNNIDNLDLSEKIFSIVGEDFVVKTREQLNETYYKMIKTEGLILNLLMSLILIVAMFNTVGAVIIMIIEKQKNIRTLYKVGATKLQVQNVFFKHGLLLSYSGGLFGLALGCFVVYVQEAFGLILLSGTSIPYPVSFDSTNFFLVVGWLLFVGAAGSYLASLVTKKIKLLQ